MTRSQGPFSLRQVIRVWALDYIAHNLQAPSVTLHYPSERELHALEDLRERVRHTRTPSAELLPAAATVTCSEHALPPSLPGC